ncbi:Holliday junction resolvase RuvX [Ectothiorhodospiraceae bacterium BW-2]|nr:Holliday junction resolvase RuvX [Ectothiorhodospiraceae bacterium BW-2]
MVKPLTLLGFDYGIRRIGVAIGQQITATARPLTTLTSIGQQPDWRAIEQLIETWRPQRLLVGRPLHMDGTEQPLTARCDKFGRQLQGRFTLPLEWFDERLSSYEAEQELLESTKRYTKAQIDALAAAKMVQSWLNQQPTFLTRPPDLEPPYESPP